ncbi:DMT family transporter [Streptomyces sp. NPDC090108]|uniref:DMT family transporter n=1 Tax=Streptomyces sp. NPDC090108 TaxID=3365947 RepID=UPI003806EB40
MNGSSRSLYGASRVVVLALLWGSTFLWIELALRGLSPLQVTLARCVLGAAVLTAVCYTSGHRLPKGSALWRHIVVAALFCNALPFALFSLGQQTVDSGLAGVLNATTPLWSVTLGVALGSERGLRPARLGGLLLGFAGVIVILAPWNTTSAIGWGALAILGAAASYAVAFTYMGRTLVRRGTPTISLSAAQLLAASGLTAFAMPIGGLGRIHPSPTAVVAALVLGVFCTAATFHLTYRIINDEGATNAAVVGYLLPVVSVLLGALVLGERLSIRVVLGMAVVLIGVGLTRRTGTTTTPGDGEPAPVDPRVPTAGGTAVSETAVAAATADGRESPVDSPTPHAGPVSGRPHEN